MKKCLQCGEVKPYSLFVKDKKMKHGCRNKCLKCNNKTQKVYRQSGHVDEDRRRETQKKWRHNNKEKAAQYSQDYYNRNKGRRLEYYKEQRELYPEKEKARNAVSNALKRGDILKSPSCECCGDVVSLEGHHEDYSLPLDVIWLCKKCHAMAHS